MKKQNTVLKKNTGKEISVAGIIQNPVAYMRKTLKKNGKKYTTFLKGLVRRKVRGLDSLAIALQDQAFKKIDCQSCANCCKTMSPTYKKEDVRRISKHLGMTFQQYSDKYLLQEEDTGYFIHKSIPCQFLLKDNRCSIYDVRPQDCGGFPYTHRKDFKLYISGTHVQNIEYCPITLNIVERMHEIIIEQGQTNLTAKNAVSDL